MKQQPTYKHSPNPHSIHIQKLNGFFLELHLVCFGRQSSTYEKYVSQPWSLINIEDRYVRTSGQPHCNPLTPKRQKNCCRNSSFLQPPLQLMTFVYCLDHSFPCISFTVHHSRFQGRVQKNFNKPRPDPKPRDTGSTYQRTASLQLLLEDDDFQTPEIFSPSLHLFENYTGNLLCQRSLWLLRVLPFVWIN